MYGCNHISEREMAIGKWQFSEISMHDTALYQILETDFMDLNADSTFYYEITQANKKMEGTWKYNNHQLYLKYSKPDTTRVFDIEILSKSVLIFNENEKHFILKRSE